jgi:hypothetical protein
METLKILLDHLYFSIICVGLGALVLYIILYSIGEASAVNNHPFAVGIACAALCFGLAGLFTYRTVKRRAERPIDLHASGILSVSHPAFGAKR